MSFRYALRELVIRRHRTIVNSLGIAVAVALVVSLFSISEAYRLAVRAPFEKSGVDLVVQRPKDQSENKVRTKGVILPDSAAPITQKEVEKLNKVSGIGKMATSIQVWSFDIGRFKVIEGVDPNNPDIGPIRFRQWINKGRFFASGEKGVAVAEKHFAKFYKLKVGDSIEISGEKFKLIGTVEIKNSSQLSAANLFLPIEEVRRLASVEPGAVNAIYIRLDKAVTATDVGELIKKEIPGSKISSPDSSLAVVDSLFWLSQKFTWLITMIIAVVAVFLVLKTVASNVFERTREIGIMKALGWTSSNISQQLSLEMLLQGILGGVLGLIIGVSVSLYLSGLKVNAPLPWQGSPIPGTIGSGAGNAGMVPLQVNLSPSLMLVVFFLAVLITVTSGLFASRRAIRIKPAEALRYI